MSVLDQTIATAKALFAGLGEVRHRKMFGGAGLYLDDTMFALIAGDTIYLKADGDLCDELAAAGSGPFVYRGKGAPVTMSYWRLPDAAGSDPSAAADWAARALAVARAAKQPSRRKGRGKARDRDGA